MAQEAGGDGVRSASVIVVGAGMSGLIAARSLVRRGTDVLVLEAADRVGGRVLAESSPLGSRIDLGGQWIGHGHHRFEALAAELDASVYPMHTPKQPGFVVGKTRLRSLSIPLLAANVALLRWDRAARKQKHPKAWTDLAVHDWLEVNIRPPAARRALGVMFTTTTCTDTDQMSMETFMRLIRYQGGLIPMIKTKGGAQERLVIEGAGTLADRLAHDLGLRVLTGQRVTRVEHASTGVTVHTERGTFRANRLIVTVPPPMVGTIAFNPALPDERARVAQNTYMGSVFKAIAVYEQPFWRDDNRNAELIALGEPGAAVFDTSPPDGPGHLCMLIAASDARRLDGLTTAERQRTILEPLVPHLGQRVTQPVSWHEKSWHLDEFVGGGYASLPKPGTTDGNFPVAHDAIGPIHWAGTETASEHAGYIEGAIESGERAADEVFAALTLG